MLALYLDAETATALAIPHGLPASDLHVTIAYLGSADDVPLKALQAAAEELLERPPVQGRLSGHGRFTGGDDGDVIVALVDSPEVEALRRAAVDSLAAQDIEVPTDHGYQPHATICYLAPNDADPVRRLPPRPVTFAALSVVHGAQRTDLPWRPAPAASVAAREAYAAGWAATGGPMTDRIRAGCVAAIELAEAQPGAGWLLEAALAAGHHEGTWAAVEARREELHQRNRAAVVAAWRKLVAGLDFAPLVRTLRHGAGVAETADPGGLAARAVELVMGLLRSLIRLGDWRALRAVMREVIAAGRAEGVADALALAADTGGYLAVGFGFEVAFEDAYRALENSHGLWTEADAALTDALTTSGADLGRLLAKMIREGATGEEMVAAAQELLADPDQRAVGIVVDLATGRALSAGATELYRREGVTTVELMSAGDTRVDTECHDAEASGPYPLASAPIPPLHPMCRCALSTPEQLPASLFSDYLTTEEA